MNVNNLKPVVLLTVTEAKENVNSVQFSPITQGMVICHHY